MPLTQVSGMPGITPWEPGQGERLGLFLGKLSMDL